MQHIGTITFDSSSTIVNTTYYNCCALASKDDWQEMNVSYSYLGWGTFGSPYTARPGRPLGSTVQNYLTGTGQSISLHHNILIGPIQSFGESGQQNHGTGQHLQQHFL